MALRARNEKRAWCGRAAASPSVNRQNARLFTLASVSHAGDQAARRGGVAAQHADATPVFGPVRGGQEAEKLRACPRRQVVIGAVQHHQVARLDQRIWTWATRLSLAAES